MNDYEPKTQTHLITTDNDDADQLQLPLGLGEAAPVVRPEYNIGKYAGYIFASPYAKNLHEERQYVWKYSRGEESIEASVTVVPLKGRKTPTTTTLRVYYALIEAWRQHGKPADGVVVFSARALAAIMGLKWAGSKTANMISEQLEILKSTQIQYVRAYQDKHDRLQMGGSINIIDDESYTQRSDLFNDEKFSTVQRVRLNKEMVDNMLSDHIRPVNHEQFKKISNDTAANLYSLLDMYLSNKPKWWRNAHGLLTEELGLQGKRYEQKKHRHAKLKELVSQLDGAKLFSGTLQLTIEPSKTKDDWKLVARKIPDKAKPGKKPRVKQINSDEDAQFMCDDIVGELSKFSNSGKPNAGFILYLCKVYPRNILDQALALTKADFREDGKNLSAVFVSEVKRLVKQGGQYKWYKDESEA